MNVLPKKIGTGKHTQTINELFWDYKSFYSISSGPKVGLAYFEWLGTKNTLILFPTNKWYGKFVKHPYAEKDI